MEATTGSQVTSVDSQKDTAQTEKKGTLGHRKIEKKKATDPDVAGAAGCAVQCGNCGCRCTIL